MTVKKVNGMMCVRCSQTTPSPYLKQQWTRTISQWASKGDHALDLGCGNGRNMRFLQSKGLEVVGVDVCQPHPGVDCHLGKDALPADNKSVSVVLLNYVLMFLKETERAELANEVVRVAKKGCVVVVEMYPAKDSRCPTDKECEKALVDFKRMLLVRDSWQTLHRAKNRLVIVLEGRE